MKDLKSVDFNSSEEVKSTQRKISISDVDNLLDNMDYCLIDRIVENNTRTDIVIKEDGTRDLHRTDMADENFFDEEKDFIENGFRIFFPKAVIREKLNVFSNISKSVLYYTYFSQDIHICCAIIFEDKIKVYVKVM